MESAITSGIGLEYEVDGVVSYRLWCVCVCVYVCVCVATCGQNKSAMSGK